MNNKVVTTNVWYEIKNEKLPIAIWGAGALATELFESFQEKGIEIDCFFYKGDEYKQPIGHGVNGRVLEISELKSRLSEVAVVLGHGHYEKYNELVKYDFIKKIYIIANPFRIYSGPNQNWINNNKDCIAKAKLNLDDNKSKRLLDIFLKVRSQDDIAPMFNDIIFCDDYIQPIIEHLNNNVVMVDAGAFRGDSVELFLKYYKKDCKKIFAIEPDKDSFFYLNKKYGGLSFIEPLQYGLSNKHGELFIKSNGSQSNRILSEGLEEDKVEIFTIDELFLNNRVDLIKIATPHFTLKILEGSEEVIKKQKPCLIINLAVDNTFYAPEIINYIKDLNSDYNLKLEFDFMMSTRLWLYAF